MCSSSALIERYTGPGGRRGGLAQRADGGHADGLGVRVHLVGAARFLGDRAHGLGLAQPGERGEPAIVLELRGPVARDHEQRGAGHLRVEELARELVGAAHDVRDDHADLAADAVVAVGHRGDQALVLADHQPVISILGDGGEEAGLRGPRVGEEILHTRVLERLEEQHAAGAGDGLAHGWPRSRLFEWAPLTSRDPLTLPSPPEGEREGRRTSERRSRPPASSPPRSSGAPRASRSLESRGRRCTRARCGRCRRAGARSRRGRRCARPGPRRRT